MAKIRAAAPDLATQLGTWIGSDHFVRACVIPAAIGLAIVAMRIAKKQGFPRLSLMEMVVATSISVVITILLYLGSSSQFHKLTIVPLYTTVLVMRTYINKQSPLKRFASAKEPPFHSAYDALLIFPITFLTALIADILCAVDIGFSLAAVGGAGWSDGLFLGPLVALGLVELAYLIRWVASLGRCGRP